MKILVAISKAPDTTAKITFKDNNTVFNEEGVQWIINPYDEWYALVRAIEIKEASPDTILHLVNVGDNSSDVILRKALALGGDEAIRVDLKPKDSYSVAAQLAAVAKEGGYDLVMTGKETIDYNSGSVGGMLAELLEMPYVPVATKLTVDNGKATIVKEIEGGEQTDEAAFPLVISCAKGMAKQRIANIRNVMAARTKTIRVVEPAALDAFTETVEFELPAAKTGVKLIAA
ncbi:MAG: electron transfer flavoprotein subunit beta/FixA family protein, partial [Sphingobacterium sp.]